MNGTKKPLTAIALVLVGATSYGLVSVVFKLAIADGWGAKPLTLQQVFSGAALLWLALGVTRLNKRSRSLARTRKEWLKLTLIGIIGLSLTTVFYNEALSRLDASLGIVLLFQFTWITILLESIRKRKWPNRQEWVAVLCIALGTALAVGILEKDYSSIDGWGILFGLLSALTYSLFFFLSGFLPQQLDPIAKSAVMSTASLAFVVLLLSFDGFDGIFESFSGPMIGWGMLLGLLGTAFPFFCFNYGIPKIGSGLAALLGSMELPAAVMAAFLLLDEPLSLGQGIGIILIIAGIMSAQRKSSGPVAAGKEGEP
ncbi:EamA family transporter [Cohnella cholangitidis]|uniref:EamA family transporter n=1 Tax=Cohnella cholangitidis TaxID=2598458 RepID=A0A7G5BX51_9BACL|nr:DMT family transporter [Cohnella cholangitidis]QMV41535.1 EamA family transporter [Cohnella cholangitidis]